MAVVFKRPGLAGALIALAVGLEYFGSPVFWIFPLIFWIIAFGFAAGSRLWSRALPTVAEDPKGSSHLGDVG